MAYSQLTVKPGSIPKYYVRVGCAATSQQVASVVHRPGASGLMVGVQATRNHVVQKPKITFSLVATTTKAVFRARYVGVKRVNVDATSSDRHIHPRWRFQVVELVKVNTDCLLQVQIVLV